MATGHYEPHEKHGYARYRREALRRANLRCAVDLRIKPVGASTFASKQVQRWIREGARGRHRLSSRAWARILSVVSRIAPLNDQIRLVALKQAHRFCARHRLSTCMACEFDENALRVRLNRLWGDS
jgi:hypothetical protein